MTALAIVLGPTLLLADVPAESASAKKVRERALRATVKVINPGSRVEGSAVLVKRSGPHVYFLTAGHVVSRADRVEIHLCPEDKAGSTRVYRSVEVLAQSAEADLAVLRLATTDPFPQPLPICPREPPSLPTPANPLSVGWAVGDTPSALAETVTKKVLVRRPGESTSILCWETKRRPARGRSGGPLIDEMGRIIGLASGRAGSAGYYNHAEEVHRFLRQNGLGWLAER